MGVECQHSGDVVAVLPGRELAALNALAMHASARKAIRG